MPNVKAGQSRTDLRNYAAGISQDKLGAVAFFLLPIVPVFATSFEYTKWAQRDAFIRAVNLRVAAGAPPNSVDVGGEKVAAILENLGQRVHITDSERDDAGRLTDPTAMASMERHKVGTLVGAIHRGVEVEWMTYLNNTISATSGVGGWLGTHADALAAKPIQELKAQMTAFLKRVGRRPNRLVFSPTAWDAFSEHPNVVSRVAGTEAGSVDMTKLLRLLGAVGTNGAAQLQVKVGDIVYDTAKTGKAASNSFVIGDQIWMTYAEDNASVDDPSGGKTFMLSGTGIEDVKVTRDEPAFTDWYNVMFRATKAVTYADAFTRIDLSTPS